MGLHKGLLLVMQRWGRLVGWGVGGGSRSARGSQTRFVPASARTKGPLVQAVDPEGQPFRN